MSHSSTGVMLVCSGHGAPAFGPTLLPTFVVRKKSRIVLVHHSSANRSRTVKRSFRPPVSLCTSPHRIFCCGFHSLQCLNRCSLVCVLYWHHPHSALSAFFVLFRYCPVFLFFCLFITRMRPIEIMARLCTVRFLPAVHAVAARCKHPFALRSGPSREDETRAKKITKQRTKERDKGNHLTLPCGRHGVRSGQE